MNAVLLGGDSIHTLGRFALFMLSQWGWWCFFGKHSKVNPLLLPSLTACSQITVLVVLGMAGQLLLGAYLLLIFGAVYLPYAFLRRERPLQSLPGVEALFLLCTMLLIFLATRGKVVFDHDNFSHWATVLNELLRTDHFPDSSRILTEHFTYPLGSAVWIYFFSKLTCANSEATWMFGQALLMLYCILPLFCFLPEKSGCIYKGLYFLFVVFLTNCILFYNILVFNLMVDSELPLVGAAASIFAFYAGNQPPCSPENQDDRFSHSVWFLTPYLCALIQIKTSGIFFVITAIAILLLKPSKRKSKDRLIQAGTVISASFVPLILWRIYCSIHFAGMTAKHDGSLSSFFVMLSRKSPDDISAIIYGAIKYFLTSVYSIEFVLVLAITFFIALFISNDSDFFQSAKLWGFLLVVYLFFTFSTIGMYVFSMPLNEASYLASISRYQRTILIYCYYIIACTLLFSVSNVDFVVVRRDMLTARTGKEKESSSPYDYSGEKTFKYAFVRGNDENRTASRVRAVRIVTLSCVLILFVAGWCYKYDGRFLTVFNGYSGSYLEPRLSCETALKQAGVPQRAKCLVLTTKEKRVYKAMLAFLLGTDRNEVTQITIDSPEQLQPVEEALLEDTWVLVVDKENALIQGWLSQKNDPHIVIIN